MYAREFANLSDFKEELFGDGDSRTTHGVKGLSGSFQLALKICGKVLEDSGEFGQRLETGQCYPRALYRVNTYT